MNICILTQPLESNYGWILQNYALQQVLKGLGHCVWTEDRKRNKIYPIDYIKKNSYIRKLFRKSKIKPSPSDLEFEIINRNINLFVERYINCTKPVNSSDKSIFKEIGRAHV